MMFRKKLFAIIISLSSPFVLANTQDQCWRTTSDSSAAENQFLFVEPSVFLPALLDEFKEMRTIFPSFTAAEESEFKDLSDKKFSNTIDNSESERLVFLGSKRDIDIFIENMIETFSYQSSAKNGDILGYLFAVKILEESHWSNLALSLKIAELKSVGEISKSKISSYISNVGSPYISALNKHILLCIIPKSL